MCVLYRCDSHADNRRRMRCHSLLVCCEASPNAITYAIDRWRKVLRRFWQWGRADYRRPMWNPRWFWRAPRVRRMQRTNPLSSTTDTGRCTAGGGELSVFSIGRARGGRLLVVSATRGWSVELSVAGALEERATKGSRAPQPSTTTDPWRAAAIVQLSCWSNISTS